MVSHAAGNRGFLAMDVNFWAGISNGDRVYTAPGPVNDFMGDALDGLGVEGLGVADGDVIDFDDGAQSQAAGRGGVLLPG